MKEKLERDCIQCGSKFFPKRIDSTCCSVKCWQAKNRAANRDSIRNSDRLYKDATRHGGRREELLKDGLVCVVCGKEGNLFEIVLHHITGNKYEHDQQVRMCRSCHAKTHRQLDKLNFKDISKEQIEEALSKFEFLDDACDFIGISRATMYQKRKMFGLADRTSLRGRKRQLTG